MFPTRVSFTTCSGPQCKQIWRSLFVFGDWKPFNNMKPKPDQISFLLHSNLAMRPHTLRPHKLSFTEPLHHVSDQVLKPGHQCQRQGSSRSRCQQQGFQDRRSWNDWKLQSECLCFLGQMWMLLQTLSVFYLPNHCRSSCSTRRTFRDGWWRCRMSAWTFASVEWTEFVVSLWSAARKSLTNG